MQLTRNSVDTNPGSSDWFTGAVYIDAVATPAPPARAGAASVHFTPGARTAWHTHPFGQTIYAARSPGASTLPTSSTTPPRGTDIPQGLPPGFRRALRRRASGVADRGRFAEVVTLVEIVDQPGLCRLPSQ